MTETETAMLGSKAIKFSNFSKTQKPGQGGWDCSIVATLPLRIGKRRIIVRGSFSATQCTSTEVEPLFKKWVRSRLLGEIEQGQEPPETVHLGYFDHRIFS